MDTVGTFADVATIPDSEKWTASIARVNPLYPRPDDIRSDFHRDFHRILHCTAYRRLKHKTQVFFATTNDHVCTRIEHVNIVQAVSETIAKRLGLNTELTNAISIGHDLGHAPFGHEGENILKKYANDLAGFNFWHEKNSLRFVDDIETLVDDEGNHKNLDLTYAVRDGIICHCGEVDQNGTHPRNEKIDLKTITIAGSVQPYTWEGCVVKISDKISYLGRDIDDAVYLKLLNDEQLTELQRIFEILDQSGEKYSNTRVMHKIIIDLCKNSSPESGIILSQSCHEAMSLLKKFNEEKIYKHSKVEAFKKYVALILHTIVDELISLYQGVDTIEFLQTMHGRYPSMTVTFKDWLIKYSNATKSRPENYSNDIVYDINDSSSYNLAAIEYAAGMTDAFAIKVFNEIVSF